MVPIGACAQRGKRADYKRRSRGEGRRRVKGWVMERSEPRPLGLVTILWTSLKVCGGAPLRFLGVSLAISVPVVYLCGAVVGDAFRYAQWSEVRNPFWLLRAVLCSLGVFIGASVFCTVLANAVFLGPVCRRVTEASGEFPGVPKWSVRKVVNLLLASAATTVTILTGLLLFIVPGIIWSVRLAFVGQIIVAEGVGFFRAFERSKELASLRPGKTTALVVLSAGLIYLAAWGGRALGLPGLWGLPHFVQPLVVLPLVLPFVSTCFVLLYCDLRAADEGQCLRVRLRDGHLRLALLVVAGVVLVRLAITVTRPREVGGPSLPAGTVTTPLHAAIDQGRSDIAESLLEEGQPLDIYTAAALGKTEYIEKALAADPSAVNRKDGNWGNATALGKAAYCGQKDVVELLLSHGADVNAGAPTPLHQAVYAGHQEVVRILLEHGANVNATVVSETSGPGQVAHKWYDTPLHIAARRGNVAIAALLLAHGADVKARNAEGGDWLAEPRPGSGLTPLGVAVKEGHKEVADLLRQHGATRQTVRGQAGSSR
jgi:ankyrin repeat protein